MKRLPHPEKMRICMTAQNFPILSRAADHGFLWPMARGLASFGHEVTVISSKSSMGQSELQREGVQVYYTHEGITGASTLRFEEAVADKFSELHSKNPFHLLHSIDSSGYRIARSRRHHKIAVAYDVAATQMSEVFAITGMSQENIQSLMTTSLAVAYKFLTTFLKKDRKLLRTANGVFVTSPQQRLALERYYLYPDHHTYTIPYGVEISDLTDRVEAKNLKQSLGLPERAQVVVTVSDFIEVAELDNLLQAFERVAVKKPQAYLIVVGTGPRWKEIEYRILSLALGSRVIMTGAVKAQELVDYISLSHLFVNMSGRTSGFEPSILEAMAQRKVVIGSEVSPIANIIEDGFDGFLLRPADIPALANLMVEIFNEEISTAEIGERARSKVVNLFDTKKMVLNLIDAYRRILGNSGIFQKSPEAKADPHRLEVPRLP